ncbi:MAG TPA: DinB family protein [Longimicrobium sp.]|nr:DinB family protein [Longimicrobium sp.]
MQAEPHAHAELMAALSEVEREVAAFFRALPADDFITPPGEAWSPAEHLRHLNRSVGAVARGFGMPRWLLRVRFGRARRPSRTFAGLRDDYRSRLAAGGRASGVYVPPREPTPPGEVEAYRARNLARWAEVNEGLRRALARWSDADLERITLPHPILGSLTAREMLFFTVYHGRHHVEAARRRLPHAAPV